MHRIPANSKVRRRLFHEGNVEEQARTDNFANVLQESIVRDRQEKSKKWSFDFNNEVPIDGDYEWFKKENGEWVGMKKNENVAIEKEKMPIQLKNENTPVHVRDESNPLVRKRRRDLEHKTSNHSVKRRVDFDQCSFLRRRRTDY